MMSVNQAKSRAASAIANAESFVAQNEDEWKMWCDLNASKIMATALEILDQELSAFNAARGIQ